MRCLLGGTGGYWEAPWRLLGSTEGEQGGYWGGLGDIGGHWGLLGGTGYCWEVLWGLLGCWGGGYWECPGCYWKALGFIGGDWRGYWERWVVLGRGKRRGCSRGVTGGYWQLLGVLGLLLEGSGGYRRGWQGYWELWGLLGSC